MLDFGSRPSSDVAQQTCSQLRPRSSRCLTSCGFSLNPASTAFQSNALTRGSMEVLDTIFVGLYRISASPPERSRGGSSPKRPACPQQRRLHGLLDGGLRRGTRHSWPCARDDVIMPGIWGQPRKERNRSLRHDERIRSEIPGAVVADREPAPDGSPPRQRPARSLVHDC